LDYLLFSSQWIERNRTVENRMIELLFAQSLKWEREHSVQKSEIKERRPTNRWVVSSIHSVIFRLSNVWVLIEFWLTLSLFDRGCCFSISTLNLLLLFIIYFAVKVPYYIALLIWYIYNCIHIIFSSKFAATLSSILCFWCSQCLVYIYI